MNLIKKAQAEIERVRIFLRDTRLAYRRAFEGPVGNVVLADLAGFCRAQESTFHKDPIIAASLAGRREVILRVMDHLRLSDQDLFDKFTGGEAQIYQRLGIQQVIHDD